MSLGKLELCEFELAGQEASFCRAGWAGLHDMQLEWLAADFGYISAPTAGHLADALAAQSRLHTLSLGVPGGEDEDSARMLLGAVRSLGAGLTALRMTCGDPVMG